MASNDFSSALQFLKDVSLMASSARHGLCKRLFDLYLLLEGCAPLTAVSLMLPHFLMSLLSLMSVFWSVLCAASTFGIMTLVIKSWIFFTEPPMGVAANALLPSIKLLMADSISAETSALLEMTAVRFAGATGSAMTAGSPIAASTKVATTRPLMVLVAIGSTSFSGRDTDT